LQAARVRLQYPAQAGDESVRRGLVNGHCQRGAATQLDGTSAAIATILDSMGKRLTSSYGRGLLRLQSAGRGETIDGSSSREVTMHARVSSYQASDP
jgi:hypothetical protein